MGRAHYRWAGLITDGPGSLPGGRAVPLRAPPRPGGGRGCLQVGQVASVCGKRHLRTSAKMWPLWGLDLNRVRCDLLFTEAINQRMQVPNRLKVAESCSPGDRRTVAEDVPASFRMHIPDRISLAEIPDTSLRPVLLTQPRKVPSVVVHVSPDPSGDLPFLPSGSRASAQRRKRSGHHSSRSRRDRTPSDCAQLAAPGQHQEGLRVKFAARAKQKKSDIPPPADGSFLTCWCKRDHPSDSSAGPVLPIYLTGSEDALSSPQ
ncbi:uncharacterized protein LOC120762000 isoform X5 [Hirundo rustica]|uniref:uncharacterized protein LOC120762000 isoform X5 n=1 Tax=Hirundo rustica TaxID=43150 RepID=UPI001A93D9E5|nr:uncharacterized protein LOC120762000 isoform X5 [Hirundo rustica]